MSKILPLSQVKMNQKNWQLNSNQIIVPTNGFDIIFNREVMDLMEWSYQNEVENLNLTFLINELYRQMGDCYNHSHVKFFHTLQGSPYETGVTGYPVFEHLAHIDIGRKLVQLSTLFRYGASMFFTIVNPTSQAFQNRDFVYNKYIHGGWVFYLGNKIINYDI